MLSVLISIQCLINSVYHEFLSLFIEILGLDAYLHVAAGNLIEMQLFLRLLGSFFKTQHVACLYFRLISFHYYDNLAFWYGYF